MVVARSAGAGKDMMGNIHFFVGWDCLRRGEKDRAKEHFTQSKDLFLWQGWGSTLAAWRWRELESKKE